MMNFESFKKKLDPFIWIFGALIPTVSLVIGYITDSTLVLGIAIGVFLLSIVIIVYSFYIKKIYFEKIHPFLKSIFIKLPPHPLGRKTEIKRLINKIKTGQSGAVVGVFGKERSEILNYLKNINRSKNIIFSYLDISLLDRESTTIQFWEIVLKPLEQSVISDEYADCQKNNFSNHTLDKLFTQMYKGKLRLVLLLDRFHDILNKSYLNQQVFLGSLRNFSASRNPSPLCLIVAVNESLRKLHQDIMKQSDTNTSVFINFMDVGEITLGVLPEEKIDSLLKAYRFSKSDILVIKNYVGGHPYLLKLLANRLKEAYQTKEDNPLDSAKRDFYAKTQDQLSMMLSSWSEKTCQAFVSVAQQNENLTDFEEELIELARQGLVYQQKDKQWRVLSPVFSELLKDKDISMLCTKKVVN